MEFSLLTNSEVDDSEHDADDEAEDGDDGFSRLGPGGILLASRTTILTDI